ncbi:MAG: hypothetical protein U0075_20270 [Thermomicrobiales bacterium]
MELLDFAGEVTDFREDLVGVLAHRRDIAHLRRRALQIEGGRSD